MNNVGDTLVKIFMAHRFESQFTLSSCRSSPAFSPLQGVLATTLTLSVVSTRLLPLPESMPIPTPVPVPTFPLLWGNPSATTFALPPGIAPHVTSDGNEVDEQPI
jgi:hypothetical protein